MNYVIHEVSIPFKKSESDDDMSDNASASAAASASASASASEHGEKEKGYKAMVGVEDRDDIMSNATTTSFTFEDCQKVPKSVSEGDL